MIIDELIKYDSIGIIEVLGYSTALKCIDQCFKNTDIVLLSIDTNKPEDEENVTIPNVFIIKFIGTISNVKLALEIAYNTAKKYNSAKDIKVHQINGKNDSMIEILKKGKVQMHYGDIK